MITTSRTLWSSLPLLLRCCDPETSLPRTTTSSISFPSCCSRSVAYFAWIPSCLRTNVSQSLNSVYSYFMECVNRNKYPEDLYESAQYIPHIVPRLYLDLRRSSPSRYMMIVTGCVCIKTKTFPCKMILKDLIDMCKGVQHPTRGLFLRYYLVKMVKNMLPDTGSDYEGYSPPQLRDSLPREGGNIIDCINLLLRSFVEMDQLWIRMQVCHCSSSFSSSVARQFCDSLSTRGAAPFTPNSDWRESSDSLSVGGIDSWALQGGMLCEHQRTMAIESASRNLKGDYQ